MHLYTALSGLGTKLYNPKRKIYNLAMNKNKFVSQTPSHAPKIHLTNHIFILFPKYSKCFAFVSSATLPSKKPRDSSLISPVSYLVATR